MSDNDYEGAFDEPDIQVDPLFHFQPIIDQHALKLTNATRKFNNRTAMAKELDEQKAVIDIDIPHYTRYITSGPGKNPQFHSQITGLQILFRKKVSEVMQSSITDDIAMATAEKKKVYTNFNTAIKTLWADKCSGLVEDKTRDEHFSHALQALDAKAKQILEAQTNHKRPRDTRGSPEGNNTKRTNGNHSPAGDTNSGGGRGIADNSHASTRHSGNNSPSANNSGAEGNGKGNDNTGGGNNQHLASAIQAGIRAYAAEQAAKTATTGAAPTTAAATTIPATGKSMATTATADEALATTPETTPTATTTADRAAAATIEPPSTTTPATTAERTERTEEEASAARY